MVEVVDTLGTRIMLMKTSQTVEDIDFERIKWKMENSPENCSLSFDTIDLAIVEYKRFLTLRMENPGVKISPTKLMDEVWHFHILDTNKYRDDCQNLFGRFIDHHPSYGPFESVEVQESLAASFESMKALYQERFGSDPVTCQASCASCNSGGTGCE